MMNTEEVLTGMKDYIAKHGWTKGELWDEHGSVCLLGASLGACIEADNRGAIDILKRVILENFPDRSISGSVSIFNDHNDTNLDDIYMVLDKAIAQAGEQGL